MERNSSLRAILNLLCGISLLAVQTASAQTLTTQTIITPTQAGSATISNGKSTIALSKEVTDKLANVLDDPSYYVVLTPVGNTAKLSLSDNNKHSFTINVADEGAIGNELVQYVVFVKQTITVPDPHALSSAPHSIKPIMVDK